jgi:hypothetical protein
MVAHGVGRSVRMRSMQPPSITGRLLSRAVPPRPPPLRCVSTAPTCRSVRRWSGSALCGGRGLLTRGVSSGSLTVRWCTGDAGAHTPVLVEPWQLPRRLEGFLQRTVFTQQTEVRDGGCPGHPHPSNGLSPLQPPTLLRRLKSRGLAMSPSRDAGGGTRQIQDAVEVRALIEQGRVTVGGEVVRDVDLLIFPAEDDVRVDRTLLDPQCYRHPTHTPLYAFHKPAFMSTPPSSPPALRVRPTTHRSPQRIPMVVDRQVRRQPCAV